MANLTDLADQTQDKLEETRGFPASSGTVKA